jgi:hypothetical protein
VAGNLSLRHFGSGRFVVKASASTLLKVLAGGALAHGVTTGSYQTIGVAAALAIALVFVAVALDAGMGLRVHQKNSPLWKTTQVLLEEYWGSLYNNLLRSGHWDDKCHIRFVVYFPLRYGFIGPSYLVAQHYLDRDEARNNDDFVIDVRTTSGWAGKVFSTGQTMVADLERSTDLVKLYLTEKQEKFVIQKLGLRSKICVPLRVGPDHILGVFSVESRDSLDRSKFQDPHVAGLIEDVARLVSATCRTAYTLRSHDIKFDAE